MIKVGETQVFYQEGMTISGLIKELKIKSIYTKVRIIQKNEKDKLFTKLRSSGNVYWMGEFSGKWDLIFAIFSKNDYEFF